MHVREHGQDLVHSILRPIPRLGEQLADQRDSNQLLILLILTIPANDLQFQFPELRIAQKIDVIDLLDQPSARGNHDLEESKRDATGVNSA